MADLALLFGQKTHAKIGAVILDASLSETHTKEVQVTDHPVEEGSNIADHLRQLPESVEINGMVSNTPLVILASLFADSPVEGDLTSPSDRVDVALKELDRIQDSGELVTVVTSLKEYSNMALVRRTATRDAATGNVLAVQMSLRRVVIAETQLLDLPDAPSLPSPADAANTSAQNLGTQPTPVAADPGPANSVAFDALTAGYKAVTGGGL